MPKIPPFLRTTEVTVEDVTGVGAYGTTYGAPRQVKCHREAGERVLTSAQGTDVVTVATLHFDPSEAIPVESKITIESEKRTVKSSELVDDLAGPQYREVHLS